MALAPRGRLPVTEVGHAAAPQLKKREEAKSKVAVVGAGRRGEEVTRARAERPGYRAERKTWGRKTECSWPHQCQGRVGISDQQWAM